jgi:hypothetical protein
MLPEILLNSKEKKMLAMKGIYQDGRLILEEEIIATKPLKVIVTFLDEMPAPEDSKIDLDKFHFKKARTIAKDFTSSLSDEIIKERREF